MSIYGIIRLKQRSRLFMKQFGTSLAVSNVFSMPKWGLCSSKPYCSVQIVLRLYQSPAEILARFDIGAPCCAYDGTVMSSNFKISNLYIIKVNVFGPTHAL